MDPYRSPRAQHRARDWHSNLVRSVELVAFMLVVHALFSRTVPVLVQYYLAGRENAPLPWWYAIVSTGPTLTACGVAFATWRFVDVRPSGAPPTTLALAQALLLVVVLDAVAAIIKHLPSVEFGLVPYWLEGATTAVGTAYVAFLHRFLGHSRDASVALAVAVCAVFATTPLVLPLLRVVEYANLVQLLLAGPVRLAALILLWRLRKPATNDTATVAS